MHFYTAGFQPSPPSRHRGYRTVASQPLIQLEPEHKEESKINELEIQISEARRDGRSVDALLEERRRTYELWITRLNTELESATDDAARTTIRRQRDRVRSQYG